MNKQQDGFLKISIMVSEGDGVFAVYCSNRLFHEEIIFTNLTVPLILFSIHVKQQPNCAEIHAQRFNKITVQSVNYLICL